MWSDPARQLQAMLANARQLMQLLRALMHPFTRRSLNLREGEQSGYEAGQSDHEIHRVRMATTKDAELVRAWKECETAV